MVLISATEFELDNDDVISETKHVTFCLEHVVSVRSVTAFPNKYWKENGYDRHYTAIALTDGSTIYIQNMPYDVAQTFEKILKETKDENCSTVRYTLEADRT